MGRGRNPRVKFNINKYGDCIRVRGFFSRRFRVLLLKLLMRRSRFIQAIFLEKFDSCVRRIVDYSFAIFSALGLCKNILHIVHYSHVCFLDSYFGLLGNICLNSWV
jgi:hypothetical protein